MNGGWAARWMALMVVWGDKVEVSHKKSWGRGERWEEGSEGVTEEGKTVCSGGGGPISI